MTADDRRALAAGLPGELLLVLIGARRLWWETNGGTDGPDPAVSLAWPLAEGWWLTDELRAAVGHPAASEWDQVFCAAVRRAMG